VCSYPRGGGCAEDGGAGSAASDVYVYESASARRLLSEDDARMAIGSTGQHEPVAVRILRSPFVLEGRRIEVSRLFLGSRPA
jgi:hypothetical protein